jgi:chromate reductase
MTRLLLISGSLRRDSLNSRLLQHLRPRLAGHATVDLLEPQQVQLPLFDQDREHDADLLAPLSALHARIAASDGVIVASPEYNGQPSAYLKNLVDWVSRMGCIDGHSASPFCDRPLLLCSASTGWSGGAVAMPHARALFAYVGALVIGDAVSIPYADQAWDPDLGFAFDPYYETRLDAATQRLLTQARHFHQQRTSALETL